MTTVLDRRTVLIGSLIAAIVLPFTKDTEKMQGPNAVLNTMSLPPGATQTQARIVIDGVRGAIFLYQNGGPIGALIGWRLFNACG